jgi:hypothetical protein
MLLRRLKMTLVVSSVEAGAGKVWDTGEAKGAGEAGETVKAKKVRIPGIPGRRTKRGGGAGGAGASLLTTTVNSMVCMCVGRGGVEGGEL